MIYICNYENPTSPKSMYIHGTLRRETSGKHDLVLNICEKLINNQRAGREFN